ncbi:DUF599 domain-containing protein [Thalassospiraceae bacterium LMO-SO8]|nr:DUF599 domain-containing protein [Alphaproteobacteria bacterium LMO-S08]WND76295.1 DUF599 domain-containing protein [Thalassospiraceae bacterium LMO-SO8]
MSLSETMLFNTSIPLLDALALAWFLAGAALYTALADQIAWGKRPMAVVLHDYRLRWMERMLERDNRMADVQIVNSYIRSGSLFISTTLLVLAGIVALLGQIEDLRVIIHDISMAQPASRRLMEFRVFILVLVFVYAFFKFAWCLRQFNYTLVMIGAAPHAGQCDAAITTQFPPRAATILSRAQDNFNRGLRSYYFALALLPWFIHPLMLFGTTVWVLLVLYRRDFRSVTLKTLAELGAADDAAADAKAQRTPPLA